MASTFQTLGDIYTIIRSLANKDSTTLPDATLLPIANKYYYLMLREIIGLREEFYAEISSADLVSAQKEYQLPEDSTSTPFGAGLIKIQRVEITYDGTNWRVAEHIPFTQVTTPTILAADVDQYYDKVYPKYYIKDHRLWIMPEPDSTDDVGSGNANLFIFWIKRRGELTSSTSIPDLPKDWLGVLQEGMLYDIFRKFNRTNDARDALQNWQVGIQRMRELEQELDEEQKYNLRTVYKNYS